MKDIDESKPPWGDAFKEDKPDLALQDVLDAIEKRSQEGFSSYLIPNSELEKYSFKSVCDLALSLKTYGFNAGKITKDGIQYTEISWAF